jgi:riboflavin synthase
MFSGIITHIGRVHNIHKKKNNCVLEIKSNMKFSKNDIGSSISCSGACLTLESYKNTISKFFLSLETLNRTNFKHCKKGNFINLEKSLMFGQLLSGHFVQGHIDTTCKVEKIIFIGKSWLINIKLPKKYNKYIVTKGSITINGVSLTIAKILKNSFQISIIPHTLKLTNLAKLKLNDTVNIEFDILAKYMKKNLK